jgi:SNF2 family DNA or RNA helicase
MNARIHRQGQNKPVFIHKIMAKDTIDETMNKSLIGGKQLTQNEFLKSILEVN